LLFTQTHFPKNFPDCHTRDQSLVFIAAGQWLAKKIAAVRVYKEETSMVDVTIVGSGLAGLVSASLLAKAGKSVTVFERAKAFGGRARTENEQGYQFNLGPHALYREGAAARLLKSELGIVPAGKIASARGALLLRGDKVHLLPGALGSLLRTRALGFAAKWEVARFFAQVAKLDPLPLQSISVDQWLGDHFRHEESRQLVRTIIRVSTYANAPGLQSAGAALQQLQCGLAGVYYLDGGWQAMVDALLAKAEQLGVRFQRGQRAESILGDEGRALGVRTADGVSHRSHATILAVPPAEASGLLASLPEHPIHLHARQALPVQAACLSVGLRQLPRPQNRFLLGMDEPLYYSVHSLTAKLAPEGGAVIQLARYMGPANEPPAETTRHQLEALLDRLQPGWRDYLVAVQYLPRMMVVPALDQASHGGLFGRPAVQMRGPDQLYFAGDWVGSEGMLADTSVASAAQCAAAILSSRGKTTVPRSEAQQDVARV
jgi:phytoene dehydrogenase-like protein